MTRFCTFVTKLSVEAAQRIYLFGPAEKETETIEAAAISAGVSTATIRNWIKTGYLESVGRGLVSAKSLEHFKKEVAGKEKLHSRANKSLKDVHNHDFVTELLTRKLGQDGVDFPTLGAFYEESLSNSYRNKEGIYYTPFDIVSDLFSGTQMDLDKATFCDPCCGGGNFISQALRLGFKPENIFGYDVDPIAVEITKERIKREAGYASGNVHLADFLNEVVSSGSKKFDCIYTNPPWGRKIDKRTKKSLGRALGAGNASDTCSLFFFACIESLESEGELGLLLPEAFFNIATYEATRRKALCYSMERMVDYGKPFKGLVTKAQAITLRKSTCNGEKPVSCGNLESVFFRSKESFATNPKAIFNLYCDDSDAEVLSHIFSLPHITLKDHAKWGLGVVTGNNKKFVSSAAGDGWIPVYKGSDIANTGLKEPSAFIPEDLSLYQQVAPRELYEAKEKLIYKFISSKLSFFHDTKQRFILNSANMLIPDADFPLRPKALADLLSSDFMNWIFSKLFNTHKILRGDIESLPIHSGFVDAKKFNESELLEQLRIERSSNGTFRIKR